MAVRKLCVSALAIAALWSAHAAAAPAETFGIGNASASWTQTGAHLSSFHIRDGLAGRTLDVTAPFTVSLGNGPTLTASDLTLNGTLKTVTLPGDPKASRQSDTQTRHAIQGSFTDAEGRLR